MRETVAMLKAIHYQEDSQVAIGKSKLVIEKLRSMKYNSVADIIEKRILETRYDMNYPRTHWTRIRTNYPLERIMKEFDVEQESLDNPQMESCSNARQGKITPYCYFLMG